MTELGPDAIVVIDRRTDTNIPTNERTKRKQEENNETRRASERTNEEIVFTQIMRLLAAEGIA